MGANDCVVRCLKKTEPVKYSNNGFAEFHQCMTACTQEDPAEIARLQAINDREEARIQERRRCGSLAFEVKRSIIDDQFVIPANQVVLPLLRAGQNDDAEIVTSQLYLKTYQSLMSGGIQFEKNQPQCAAAREVFAGATHLLLGFKHELLFRGEDSRVRFLGQDPSKPPALREVVIKHLSTVGMGGASVAALAETSLMSGHLVVGGLVIVAVGELGLVGASYLFKNMELGKEFYL